MKPQSSKSASPAEEIQEFGIFSNTFCIPYNDKHIIYMPLKGIILLANSALVNLLYNAGLGDQKALDRLGLNESLAKKLFETKPLPFLLPLATPPAFAPTSISLFLTTDCTLRCRYCYAAGGESHREMTWEMITGLLEEVMENVLQKKMNRLTIHFHGGGDISAAWPLLERTKNFADELVHKANIELYSSIGLNGILTSDQQHWIIRNTNSATVSIDGPAAIQNTQRPFPDGGPSFALVDATLRAFDKADYPYAIRTTVTAESVLHMEEILTFFCENYQAKKIKVEPMYPRGRAASQLLAPPDATLFVEHYRRAQKIAWNAGRELSYSGARLQILTHVFCQAAGESCAVTPDGQITSCYEVIDSADPLAKIFIYGHFNTHTRRMEIDTSRREQLYHLSVLNKPFCSKCFCKWHCAGDCPAKSLYAETAETPVIPDRCVITRELMKDQLIQALAVSD
jgi:uncharacterized protein